MDCCPYVGVLSLNALFACDHLIIPVSTDYLSLKAAEQMTRTLEILEPVLKRRLNRRYVDYLRETGFPGYGRTPGNRGVLALRRIVGDRAEFLLVSLWESEEAVRRFAGDDMTRAVFYPEDDRFLVERDERVHHFEVVYAAEVDGV